MEDKNSEFMLASQFRYTGNGMGCSGDFEEVVMVCGRGLRRIFGK